MFCNSQHLNIFCEEKYIRISKFLKFLDFWILDSAWSLTHDVPFWLWNLSDTTHVRSHTKFQLILAINTHSLSECGFEIPKTYRAPAHIWGLHIKLKDLQL